MTRPHRDTPRCASTLLIAVVIASMGIAAACMPYRRIPVVPGVSFEAHLAGGGLLVDEMRGDRPTLAKAPPWSWTRVGDGPTLVMQEGATAGEGIWLTGPGRAVVRASSSPDAAIVGRVDARWDDEAIQLIIEPAGAPALSSGVFVREVKELGPDELTRRTTRDDELYGSYRAPLRTVDGKSAGWLEVKVGDEGPARVIYEAALPPGIDEALAVASAAALGRELDWIYNHTLDSVPGMVDRP